ncbi:hypothetical protein SAMN04515621_0112 [Erythrobacter sp. HL-111]|nr:hypothetical protein SAMN04515621_0112 [Erythrobacter sp. HL-111]
MQAPVTHAATSDRMPERGEPTWKALARVAFLIATLIAALALLWNEWPGISAALAQADDGLILLAALAAMANVAMTAASWRVLLIKAPIELSPRASAQIFFVGQIGKYLPGTLWSFIASGELAQREGFPRGVAMASLGLALLIGLASGIFMALALLPKAIGDLTDNRIVLGAALVFVVLGFIPKVQRKALRMARIDFPVPLGAIIASLTFALLAWFLAGAQIVLLSQAVGAPLDWSDWPQVTSGYAFAWVAGLLVFFAPAGLGAREAGLLAVLSLSIGLAEASAIVLLSRLAVTFADFACAGIALVMPAHPASPAAALRRHRD